MEGDLVFRVKYPAARRDESFVSEFFGTKVADPYRWMEDPDAEETKQFVEAQNSITLPYINECPARQKIEQLLTEMWDYPKYSVPRREGSRYFYFLNTGVQNQSALYVQDGLEEPARLFFDPNELSSDGTVSISTYKFSESGDTFAYALSEAGSDWVTIRFKDVATGKDYPEVLRRIKLSSVEWTHDDKGVFYSKYPVTEAKADGTETDSVEHQKLFYHRLGTEQSEDVLVVEFPEEPKWRISAVVSYCGRYVFIVVRKECRDNLLYFADLELQAKDGIKGKLDLTPICTKFEADLDFITNNGSKALFRTNKSAPNYRVVEIDVDNPAESNWKTFIPEHSSDVLDWVSAVDGDKLILCYIRDVKDVLQVHDLSTGDKLQDLDVPVGSVMSYFGRRKHSEMFYKIDSFLSPGTTYRVDFAQGKPFESQLFRRAEVKGLVAEDYETKQVFFTSKDGTRVPMFITHRRDLELDGSAPTLLYGYGGFNVSLKPWFSLGFLAFVRSFRGVSAVANIRGGGEYGEKWHDGGRLLNKQNVFDDFQSAAQFLIDEKYTSSSKLTIRGDSNGGYLVGACLNQRPDLFGAGIAGVGVMDLLRFHKFTIGHAWTSDYGNPDEKEDQFRNNLKLSPLHNVPKDADHYPALLLLTGDHDDRVVPLHSLKFIAEVQHVFGDKPGQTKPLLIRVDTKAGHGGGKPTKKVIQELSDVYAFVMRALNLKYLGENS